jgi:drug/metabolite transporter (DMT)-like permease
LSLSPTATSTSIAGRPSRFALGAGLATVLLFWAGNYIVGKITLTHMSALTLVSFRFELSAALLLGMYFAQRRRTPLRARDVWRFAYLGLLGFGINQGCYVFGLAHTTSQHSVVIVALDPILILLLASAMKLEKLTAAKAIGMVICFFGVLLLETERGSPMHSPLLAGDLITFAGAMGFSLYTVLGKRVSGAYDTLSMNTFNATAAAILFLPLALHEGIRLDWKGVGWAGWAGLFYMGALAGVTSYLLFYWLLRHMEASRVVAMLYFQPVVVFLLSVPLLGERLTWRVVASAALVVLGVYLAERVSARERRRQA